MYDVFLNFRGPDTRQGFTGYLQKALRDRGIVVFFDDKEIQGGQIIQQALAEAIENSRIAITVFSTNYASSSCCLDELAIILEYSKSKELLVLPVFYKVSPCEVRHQHGIYGEALVRLETRNHDKMENWKMALREVSYHSGFSFKDGYPSLPIFVIFVGLNFTCH